MEIAFQIFVIVGFVFLILAQILRFIDEHKMGKWIKINQEAKCIVIYILDETDRPKALDLRKQIQYFTKFYSCGYTEVDNKLIFDDDSAIEICLYSSVESPIGAEVSYFPKRIRKNIAPLAAHQVYFY